MDPLFDPRNETRSALKLSLRSFGLVVLGSGLWHLPVDTLWVRAPAIAGSAFIFLYAAAGIVLSATVWRNTLWHVLGPAGDRGAGHRGAGHRGMVIALSAFCIAGLAAAALGLFHLVGRLLAL